MISGILIAVFSVLAISGLCDLLFILKLCFKIPKTRFKTYILVFLTNGNYIGELNLILEKKNWYGSGYCDGIIADTSLLDENIITSVKELYKNDDIIFVNGENSLNREILCRKKNLKEIPKV